MKNDIQILYTSWARKYCHKGVYSHEDKNINTNFMERKDIFEGHTKQTGGLYEAPVLLVEQPFFKACDMQQSQTMHWTLSKSRKCIILDSLANVVFIFMVTVSVSSMQRHG
jgi:hypothetical protein